jgi:hypothetical protein
VETGAEACTAARCRAREQRVDTSEQGGGRWQYGARDGVMRSGHDTETEKAC